MIYKERQITFDLRNHQLSNINVWTPDSQWLVYDLRPDGGSFTSKTIEKIHVNTREVTQIYQANSDAHVGVVTVSPNNPPRYAFIHGPENPDKSWQYDFHHRRGVYVKQDEWGYCHNIDALSLTPPFVAGALRGGTHVHIFSPDGQWLSFTYNDHIMHELNEAWDQRNVAVAVPVGPVIIDNRSHPREYDGEYFCCQITTTTVRPSAGSDDITRAYEEGWVGKKGYRRKDGGWQQRAIVFIGDTLALSPDNQAEKIVPEIFIVDLPDDPQKMKQQGEYPLQGTEQLLPAPPYGVKQRRLTFTHHLNNPGLALQPRHWLRTSPDGSQIACLRQDDHNVVQLWLVSTCDGELRQVTHGDSGVQSAFSWDNTGEYITFIYQNSVALCQVSTGKITKITTSSIPAPCAEAVVFSPDNSQIAFMRDLDGYRQIFTVDTNLSAHLFL